MAKLQDFIINNFSGGLVRNKSDLEMQRNEFVNTLNMDLEEPGKAKRRRGSRQFGTTISGGLGIIAGSFVFSLNNPVTGTFHVFVERQNVPTLYKIVGTYTTAAITPATTTITVADTAPFAVSGSLEINGDLITYAGKTATTFTDCAGIRVNHPAFSPVQQTISVGALSIDARTGLYFCVLNNLLFIGGDTLNTFNGVTIADVVDADEPTAIFHTIYRSRIYSVGRGDPKTVYFSDAGDGTSWTAANFFVAEDDIGEWITGLRELNDQLLIFKLNSIFTYDEVQLKQRVRKVGAYNHEVIKKIGNLVYTFCPEGVFITNGFTAKKISDPVDKYLRHFRPQYETTRFRVVTNCFAAFYQHKYFLFIGNITEPEVLSNVVLVYDTIRNNWTVYDGLTGLTHLDSFNSFLTGLTSTSAVGGVTMQHGESLFGAISNKYLRLFDGRFLDNAATRTEQGGDIIPDLLSDNAGSPISTVQETKWLDLGHPGTWKLFPALQLVVEQGEFHVSYKLDLGKTQTDWMELGGFAAGTRTRKLLKNEGYRIKLRATSNSLDVITILNALILKNPETIDRPIYAEYERI